MENAFTTLIKDFIHRIGLHQWYYADNNRRRACVRCGIIQKRSGLNPKKWINER